MANEIMLAKPGDLIRAEAWNSLVSTVLDMKAQLNDLTYQGSLAPVIERLNPTGPITVGTRLEVIGRNFSQPGAANLVTVAGLAIEAFDVASNDRSLIFNVPMVNFTGSQFPTQVTVRARNQVATYPIILVPAVQLPEGFVVFAEDAANAGLGNIVARVQPYVWKFTIDTQTTLAESYVLSRVVSVPTGSTVTKETWESNIRLVDASGAALSSGPIRLEPNTPLPFGVSVVVPGGAPTGTKATFTVHAAAQTNPNLSRNSDPITITVGSATEVSDPRVQWANETPVPGTFTPNKAQRVTDTATGKEYVEIPYNGFGTITVRATFASGQDSGGNYTYVRQLDSDATGIWNIDPPSPPDSSNKNPGENEVLGIIVRLTASAAANHPEERVLTIRANRTSPTAFSSFTRINIRGYTPAA